MSEPDTEELATIALTLAITARTDDEYEGCLAWAEQLSRHLDEQAIQRVMAFAEARMMAMLPEEVW